MKGPLSSITLAVLAVAVSSSIVVGQDYQAQAAHSPDAALRRVALFLVADSAVQGMEATDQRFFLMEDHSEKGLEIVGTASTKAELHREGRDAGAFVISGGFQPGVIAAGKVVFYVFRRADDG